MANVLTNISLKLVLGKMYALVGASGSGKTTLVHLLAGILRPDDGVVAANGAVVSALSEGDRDTWRRRNCGMIFQDFRLLDELGAVSNVLLPTWFGARKLRGSPAVASRLLAELGVPANRVSVARLSRGEQQRVALARALISDPPIILADEPTASLDEANASELVSRLTGLRDQGKLVVSATHDPRLIEKADVVLELQNGRLVSDGQEIPQ